MHDHAMPLANQVVLVTGASGEIGQAIVKAIASQGGNVLIHYGRDHAGAQTLLDEIAGNGWIVSADLSKPEGPQTLWNECIALTGQIHAIVNNAGVRNEASIDADMDIWQSYWRTEFQINFFSAVDLCKLAIPHFKSLGGGRVVNIASRAGQRGYSANALAYGASKAALINLSKSIARSFGSDGVTAVTLAPGWVNTQMAKDFVSAHGAQAALGEIPIGRMAELSEVGEIVAFMLHPRNASLSGATIDMNGASYTR